MKQQINPAAAAIVIAVVLVVAIVIAWRAFNPPAHEATPAQKSAGQHLDPRANPMRGPKAERYRQPQ